MLATLDVSSLSPCFFSSFFFLSLSLLYPFHLLLYFIIHSFFFVLSLSLIFPCVVCCLLARTFGAALPFCVSYTYILYARVSILSIYSICAPALRHQSSLLSLSAIILYILIYFATRRAAEYNNLYWLS